MIKVLHILIALAIGAFAEYPGPFTNYGAPALPLPGVVSPLAKIDTPEIPAAVYGLPKINPQPSAPYPSPVTTSAKPIAISYEYTIPAPVPLPPLAPYAPPAKSDPYPPASSPYPVPTPVTATVKPVEFSYDYSIPAAIPSPAPATSAPYPAPFPAAVTPKSAPYPAPPSADSLPTPLKPIKFSYGYTIPASIPPAASYFPAKSAPYPAPVPVAAKVTPVSAPYPAVVPAKTAPYHAAEVEQTKHVGFTYSYSIPVASSQNLASAPSSTPAPVYWFPKVKTGPYPDYSPPDKTKPYPSAPLIPPPLPQTTPATNYGLTEIKFAPYPASVPLSPIPEIKSAPYPSPVPATTSAAIYSLPKVKVAPYPAPVPLPPNPETKWGPYPALVSTSNVTTVYGLPEVKISPPAVPQTTYGVPKIATPAPVPMKSAEWSYSYTVPAAPSVPWMTSQVYGPPTAMKTYEPPKPQTQYGLTEVKMAPYLAPVPLPPIPEMKWTPVFSTTPAPIYELPKVKVSPQINDGIPKIKSPKIPHTEYGPPVALAPVPVKPVQWSYSYAVPVVPPALPMPSQSYGPFTAVKTYEPPKPQTQYGAPTTKIESPIIPATTYGISEAKITPVKPVGWSYNYEIPKMVIMPAGQYGTPQIIIPHFSYGPPQKSK